MQGGVTRELYYLGGSDGLNAILVRQNNANTFYYVHPDHLGSLAVVTDASGNIVQKCSFDAWGRRELVQGSLIFDRGYTGHEHLDEFSLINMNGRIYDPVVGRFLSPDPYVADGAFSQDYNRYSYARNNPLTYTDPSGEIVWMPIIMGAVMTAHMYGMNSAMQGDSYWSGAWKGAIVGGTSAFVGGVVGDVVWKGLNMAGFWGGAISNFSSGLAGGLVGATGNSIINGCKFDLISVGIAALVSGLIGGIDQLRFEQSVFERSFAWVDNPGQCLYLGDDLYQYRYSIPEVVVQARMPLHLTPIAQSIHSAHFGFWNAAPTRIVTGILTSMIGGGLVSGYSWAYSTVKGIRGTQTLYRAVSKAELDDIAINGIRNASGYNTGKLFATSAQDAANFGKISFHFDKQPFYIIKTSIPNRYSSLLYRGEMDLMKAISVPKGLFGKLAKPINLNYTPIPKSPLFY